MTKQRRHYETAFKLEVARMVVDLGRTAINRWIKQYRAEQQGKSGIGKLLTAELQHIRQLFNLYINSIIITSPNKPRR